MKTTTQTLATHVADHGGDHRDALITVAPGVCGFGFVVEEMFKDGELLKRLSEKLIPAKPFGAKWLVHDLPKAEVDRLIARGSVKGPITPGEPNRPFLLMVMLKDSADAATERLVRAARDSTAELLTSLGLGHEPLTSDGCRQLDQAYLDEFRAVDGFDQPYWLGSQVSVGEERVHAG